MVTQMPARIASIAYAHDEMGDCRGPHPFVGWVAIGPRSLRFGGSVMAETYDWSRFDVHMPIACDAPTAFAFWATSGGMERFYVRRFAYAAPDGARRAADAVTQVGDTYALTFDHPFDLSGRVLAVEPNSHLAFTFGSMRVEVHVEPHVRGTIVRLVQSDIPTDDVGRAESHLNCRSCWVYYLLNLRSVIEHGHDLRDAGLPDNPVSINFGRASSGQG